MEIVQGDLIKMAKDGHFDVIVHGCNCFLAMGAGVAYKIRKAFPSAAEADQRTVRGDQTKLGTYSSAEVRLPMRKLTVVNAYTQFGLAQHASDVVFDYEAFRQVLRRLATNFADKRIGMPKIGSGLAGGNWGRIKKIIEEELDEHADVTVVVYMDETL